MKRPASLAGLVRALAAVLVACGLLAAGAGAAQAHPAETSAVLMTVHEDSVDLELQVPVRQYDQAADAALDVDGGDVEEHAEELAAYTLARLGLADADGALDLVVASVTEATVNDLPTAVIEVVATAPDGSVDGDLTLDYSLLIDRIATHEVYVSMVSDWADGTVTDEEPALLAVMDWEHTSYVVDRDGTGWASGVAATIRLGIDHIAAGPDHVLFLILLLVPAPLLARGRRWTVATDDARADGRRALRRAGLLVSCFTVGHTASLALVSTGLLSLPTVVTESLVAGTIIVAGVHALLPLARRGEAWTAGAFGVVHGTAFATTLVALDLSPGALAAAILSFNVGVELAQLVVVVALLPALVWASRSTWYGTFRWGIAGVGVLAGATWLAAVIAGRDSVLSGGVDWVVAHPWQSYAIALAVLAGVAMGPRAARRVGSRRDADRMRIVADAGGA
ncbi:HupE/UreJ family protein [Demequina sp. SYSU T00192]|uniref:HupE/UreJ family protein n=1 Tax=Demequina litoralis TaxID=3051660 RepID=A0ABT8G7F8_9MICO|nr:HupE/UreJ family protein [Demequina sp. SYSU T00192]MDN4475082.1 HupE/UreJ family protein [Demequina sp. SYSU T00192]